MTMTMTMAARRPNPLLLRSFVSPRRTPPRWIHIKATPSTTSISGPVDLSEQTQAIPKLSGAGPFPADVRFEVLGAPYSMLSVALPASSMLYSRRGTLVGVNGQTENAISTLSMLEPFRRALLRIPFLYQKISSTTPLTCLISTNTPHTTFGVIELDGKADWMLTQPDALLAWTGHSLSSTPSISHHLTAAHWGNTRLTGRGLVALIGRGQIYQLTLKPDEEFIIHPRSLLAYSMTSPTRPLPYRLKSTVLRLQVPRLGLGRWIGGMEWVKALRESGAWKGLARALWEVRTWMRRTVWGDRLFLRFHGPSTILVQSRTGRISDVLRKEEVGEWADTEPGAGLGVQEGGARTKVAGEYVVGGEGGKKIVIGAADERPVGAAGKGAGPKALKVAIVGKDGKLEFQDSDFRAFTRS